MSDTPQTHTPVVADSVGQQQEKMSANVGQRPTQSAVMADSGGHGNAKDERDAGHDPDLPERDARFTLTTYEAGRMFEEAECRVSERTIIRWCNRNRLGNRRLACAFDTTERKYYIAEESVKGVIREELNKGRQSEVYSPDLSDIEREMSDVHVGHEELSGGQWRTVADTDDRQTPTMTDKDGQHADMSGVTKAPVTEEKKVDGEAVKEEVMTLKIELAKLEEQAKTKDEMMTYLRKEIDRRGEQIAQDREVYERSLVWFREQVERKDLVIERLNVEVRGLLEAPRQSHDGQGSPMSDTVSEHYGQGAQFAPSQTRPTTP